MADVPRLTTERLTLRGHRLDDFDDCAAMWGDPEVMRYLGGVGLGREEVWTKLLRYVGHWALLGYGFWVVEETATGRFVGEVGLGRFERELAPPLATPAPEAAPEAGWVLAAWAHGRGFAAEALGAALRWGDTVPSFPRTVCLIHPGNLRSLALAGKAGFSEAGHTTYRGAPAVVLERPLGRPGSR